MINIALFGAPGAGKGTQSKLFLEKYKLTYISTGDMLRTEIAEKTTLGMMAKEAIEQGKLVSDEIIVQIIEEKIKMSTDTNGFLFDGFPRTVVQAYILEGLLLKMGMSLTCMISLDVPREELITRMVSRAEKENRSDDRSLEVINHRLNEYEQKTIPVADFYRAQNKFFSVDGLGTIDEIFSRVDGIIEKQLENIWLNIILFGPPGAGKGTQAKKLANEFQLVYVSTGELIREEIANNTEMGGQAQPFLEKGNPVPDEIAIRLIEQKVQKSHGAKGFIFKGFPSTLVQAYILDGMLQKMGSQVSCVYEINSPTLQSVKRLTARAKTENARVYDMDMDVIIHRLEVFEKFTKPVRDFYEKRNLLQTFDGVGDENVIFGNISEALTKAFKNIR
jgi:adenylate kinase